MAHSIPRANVESIGLFQEAKACKVKLGCVTEAAGFSWGNVLSWATRAFCYSCGSILGSTDCPDDIAVGGGDGNNVG